MLAQEMEIEEPRPGPGLGRGEAQGPELPGDEGQARLIDPADRLGRRDIMPGPGTDGRIEGSLPPRWPRWPPGARGATAARRPLLESRRSKGSVEPASQSASKAVSKAARSRKCQ